MATKSYLLLGEGDFTFSLDVCRYLASSPPAAEAEAGDGTTRREASSPSSLAGPRVPGDASLSITCTGVDALEDLRSKYRDVDFTLRGIRSCSSGRGAGDDARHDVRRDDNHSRDGRLDATILHGVNAVQAEPDDVLGPKQSYDHVIFNHPHLGTEDARLHSRFLRHLFHASARRWMKAGTGLLHLALVDGQFSRWDCLGGARRHGLTLLRRGGFRAPPPPRGGGQTYYCLRRHQSGRSFAGRRLVQGGSVHHNGRYESETLVFGRACDYGDGCSSSDDIFLLPWERANPSRIDVTKRKQGDAGDIKAKPSVVPSETSMDDSARAYSCSYCSKSFRENRSLKNHMLCSHPESAESRALQSERKAKKKKRRRPKEGEGTAECPRVGDAREGGRGGASPDDGGVSGPPWICSICESEGNAAGERRPPRAFPHRRALLDHRRAKHLGDHPSIKPDWCRAAPDGSAGGAAAAIGRCPVCDAPYSSEADRRLVPPRGTGGTPGRGGEDLRCRHCARAFRELRARRQHENFCPLAG